jgi:hypothetical protein
MIIYLEDLMGEMEAMFPDIKPESLKDICKKGCRGITKTLSSGNELVLKNEKREEMKFYRPMSIERHTIHVVRRHRKRKQQEELNGK